MSAVATLALALALKMVALGWLAGEVVFVGILGAMAAAFFLAPGAVVTAVILLLPFEALAVPFLPLRLQLALFFATGAMVASLLLKEAFPQLPIQRVLIIWFAVLAASIVQTYLFDALIPPPSLPGALGVHASRHRGWYHLAALFLGVGVLLLFTRTLGARPRLRAGLAWFLGVTTVVSAFGIYEFAAKLFQWPLVYFSFESPGYISLAVFERASIRVPRVYGTGIEPLSFGNFLLPGFAIAASMLARGQFLPRPFLIAAAVTSFVAILLTFSTSAWFGLAAILVVLIAFAPSRSLRIAVAGTTGVLAIMAATQFTPIGEALSAIYHGQAGKVANLFTGGTGGNLRNIGMRRALEIIREHPVLGVGLGNEPFWMGDPAMSVGSYNIFLSAAVETGLIGLAAFLTVVGASLWAFFCGFRRARDPAHARLLLGVFSGLLGILVSHLAWGNRFVVWTWFVLAVGFAALRSSEGDAR